ncbi:MAG: hypothetical protein DMG56_14500 [Acidobacteria bacterium]|nr:MAG: hypothetical protein DMG55_26320 [Acidobacteriota bacterium]PYU60910.1 MAG: hypothetical protein DMG56_14500 [Acidobacteriota bacterium]
MKSHPKSYHAWCAATPTRAFPTLLEGRASKSFTKAIFCASPSSRNLPLGPVLPRAATRWLPRMKTGAATPVSPLSNS